MEKDLLQTPKIITRAKKLSLSYWAPTFAVALTLLLAAIYIDRLNNARAHEQSRANVLQQLSVLRAHLEGKLFSTLQTVQGLAAAITVEPDMDQARFAQFASPLIHQQNQLRNVAAAPNMIISMVYPLEGNRQILGLNYELTPTQKEAAQRVKQSGKAIVAGPVNLVQGGTGFIGRIPVYVPANDGTEKKKFWGLLSAVINAEDLYKASGLTEYERIDVAIRGRDGLGENGQIFYGNEHVFSSEPETLIALLPGGSWQLAAIPKNGWAETANNSTALRLILLFISAVIVTISALLARASQKRGYQQKLLRGLFDLSPIGITLNDFSTGEFLRTNKALIEPTGYTEEEFLNLSYWDLTPETYKDQEEDQLKSLTKTGRYGPYEKHYIRKDGSHYPVLLNGILVEDESGKKLIWSIIQDLSAQKQADLNLKKSQIELQKYFDLSLNFMCIANSKGYFEKINDSFFQRMGYSRETILSTPFMDFVHPDDKSKTLQEFENLQNGLSTLCFINRFRRKNGSYLSLQWNATPDPDSDKLYATALDITDNKKNEIALTRAHKNLKNQMVLLESIATALSSTIAQLDTGDTFDLLLKSILATTRSQAGFIGEITYSRENIPKIKYHSELDIPEIKRNSPFHNYYQIEEQTSQALSTLKPVSYSNNDDNSTPLIQNCLVVPIVYATRGIAILGIANRDDGYTDDIIEWLNPLLVTIGQIVKNIRTINERDRAEAELIFAKEKAESAANTKSEFLAIMSHEIRTPINGVLGMLNLLQSANLETEHKRKLNIAKTSADALLVLINDILDFSKIDAGKLYLENQQFNIIDLLGQFAESQALNAQKKEIELILDTIGIQECYVNGDSTRLQQILTNLVSNAIKFTDKGEIIIKCSLVKTQDGYHFNASVSDTGIGIPKEKIKGLFDPFTQVDASTTRKYGGTGLGLAICKRLCEQMNGEISVSTTESGGSCFNFSIELNNCTETASPAPSEKLDNFNILVLDDNINSCQNLAAQLNIWGANCICTHSIEQALQTVQSASRKNENVDLFLIDHILDNESGLTFIQKLRELHLFDSSPVSLMTDLAHPPEDDNISQLNIATIFHKPVIHRDLKEAIDSANSNEKSPMKQPTPGEAIPGANPLVTAMNDKSNTPTEIKILLVEDNLVNQEVACMMLEDLNVTVDIANDGVEAIEILQLDRTGKKYSLILMDCQMPNMDGYEATHIIRREKAGAHYKNIPIIAMTAHAMSGDREKCIAAGMNDYLSKPVDPETLNQTINKWLNPQSQLAADDKTRPDSMASQVANGNYDALLWDYETLIEQLKGRDDRLRILLKSFTNNSERMIQEFKEALARNDAEKIAFIAHTTKGTAGNLKATTLRQLALDLEEAGKSDDNKKTGTLGEEFISTYTLVNKTFLEYLNHRP